MIFEDPGKLNETPRCGINHAVLIFIIHTLLSNPCRVSRSNSCFVSNDIANEWETVNNTSVTCPHASRNFTVAAHLFFCEFTFKAKWRTDSISCKINCLCPLAMVLWTVFNSSRKISFSFFMLIKRGPFPSRISQSLIDGQS